MPDGELDPADGDTWDNLHPLSSEGTPHFRKAAAKHSFGDLDKEVKLLRLVSSLSPLPTDTSLLVLLIKLSDFTHKIREMEKFSRKGSKPHNPAYKKCQGLNPK